MSIIFFSRIKSTCTEKKKIITVPVTRYQIVQKVNAPHASIVLLDHHRYGNLEMCVFTK